MFYVDKYTVNRYWWACAGRIEERIGYHCNNEGEFDTVTAAMAYARQEQFARLTREYNSFHRFSKIAVLILYVRSRWNKQLRENLINFQSRADKAWQNLANPPQVQISHAPDQIPVQGSRLSLETTVYLVDSYNLVLEAAKVMEERISYYDFNPQGSIAYYDLDNGRHVTSTMTSSYANQEIFLGKSEAESRMRQLIQEKLNTLEGKLKELQ